MGDEGLHGFLTVMENKLDEGRMITFEEAVELAKGKIEDEKLFLLADKLCKKNMAEEWTFAR